MSVRNQTTDAAVLMCSATKHLLSRMLPAKREDTDGHQDEQGIRAKWDTRFVHEIDGEMADTIERNRSGRWAVVIRPPEESDEDPGNPSKRLLQAVYGEFPRLSLEIAEIDDQIVYRIVCFARSDADHLVNRVMSLTECEAEIKEKPALPVEKGDFAAISRICYEKDHLLPVAHDDSKDREEPYRALLDTLSGEWDGKTTIQMVVEPVDDWTTRWARGCPIGSGRKLLDGTPLHDERFPSMVFAAMITAAISAWWVLDQGPLTIMDASSDPRLALGRAGLFASIVLIGTGVWTAAAVGYGFLPSRVTASQTAEWQRSKPWTERSSTKTERADVDPISRQSEAPGYRVSMRVVTTAENRMKAAGYHRRVVRSLRNSWHNHATGQGFTGKTVGDMRERPFRKMLDKIATRRPDRDRRQRWTDKLLMRAVRRFPMYMSDSELSSTMRYPDRSVGGASMIEFTTTKTDDPSAKADEFDGFNNSEPDAKPINNNRKQPTEQTAEPTSISNETETDTIEAEPVEEMIENDR